MKKIFQKFLVEKRSLARLAFFLWADIILISLSVIFAFLVRFEGFIPEQYFLNIWSVTLLAIVITLPIFYFSKLYSFSWAYVSATELISLVKAVSFSFLLLTAVFFVLRDHSFFSGFPRSTLFISYFFIFLFSGGVRFAKRIYLEVFSGGEKGQKERTLIVGAGDAGEQILRSILASKNNSYLPIGFVDDDAAKQKVLIHGFPVLGKIEDLPRIISQKEIRALIVALPSAGGGAIKRAVQAGRAAGLKKIKIIPPFSEIINGQISLGDLRDVQADDLLKRRPADLDEGLIKDFLKAKKILVTGAAGSIGSEFSRQLLKFKPKELILLDQDETGIFNLFQEMNNRFSEIKKVFIVGDIQDRIRMENIFKKYSPQIIFHAAAYKHVPLMELQPEEAVKNNIFGTKILAELSLKYGAEKFIFISTDKAVNPVSVMGATKRVGEMICQAMNNLNKTKFISVRFGNVLDSRGSVVPIFRDKIKKREPIEITHAEMKRYFMTTPEACLLVLEAGAMGQGGEVFVLDMGKPIKILNMAKEMIRLSGLEPDKDIPIVFTEPRPGEKIFEEILTGEEGVIATKNKKIFKAKLSKVDKDELERQLRVLRQLIEHEEKEKIIDILKKIIPSYKIKM